MDSAFSLRRLFVLLRKEFVQILGNRQVLYILLFPPIVQVALLGYAMNPLVKHVTLAVSDESRTPASRRAAAYATGTTAIPATADSERSPYSAVPATRVHTHART